MTAGLRPIHSLRTTISYTALIHSSLTHVYLRFRIQVITGLHIPSSVLTLSVSFFWGGGFQRLHP